MRTAELMTLRSLQDIRSASLLPLHAPVVLALMAATACTISTGDTTPEPQGSAQVDSGLRAATSAGEDSEVAPDGAGAKDPSVLLTDPEMSADERARYAVDPSALLYKPDARRPTEPHHHDDDDTCFVEMDAAGAPMTVCPGDGTPAPAGSADPARGLEEIVSGESDALRTDTPAWNMGFRATRDQAVRIGDPNGPGLDFSPAPVRECHQAYWWSLREDLYFKAWAGSPHFRAPNNAFDADGDKQIETDPAEFEAARAFLAGQRAHMPFTLAFRHPDVVLGSGWFYDSGKSHRGLDYSRTGVPAGTDPTFEVVAMGDGIVRKVLLMGAGGGNVVVIEHPRKNGPSLWSLYMHLRNGATADRAAATAMTAANSGTDTCVEYAKFIAKYPNSKAWGTEEQRIAVKEGDLVRRGQPIGWAGNTGCGGIAGGLDANGDPFNTTTVNTHLHVYFGASLPGATAKNKDGTVSPVVVFLDPYGVYLKADDRGCYDLGVKTGMPRLIAPFDPDFRGVPADVLAKYFGYFQQMGWGVKSLSPSYAGGALTFSGSLQPDTGSWAVRADLSADKVAGEVAKLATAGMRPREVNVARKNGEPRHTIVFGSVSKNEAWDYVPARNEEAYLAAWNEKPKAPQPMLLVDYASWGAGSDARIEATFTSAFGGPKKFFRERTVTGIADVVAAQRAVGFGPQTISVNDDTTRFSGVFTQTKDTFVTAPSLSGIGFEFVRDAYRIQGYRTTKVQSYNGGQSYVLVMRKAAPSAIATP